MTTFLYDYLFLLLDQNVSTIFLRLLHCLIRSFSYSHVVGNRQKWSCGLRNIEINRTLFTFNARRALQQMWCGACDVNLQPALCEAHHPAHQPALTVNAATIAMNIVPEHARICITPQQRQKTVFTRKAAAKT